MDYHKAAKTIATTIELGCGKALTDEQFTLMAGAVAVMLEKATTDEREACAKVCDELAHEWRGANSQIIECADKIRTRSNASGEPGGTGQSGANGA